jgi:hypothetical protein
MNVYIQKQMSKAPLFEYLEEKNSGDNSSVVFVDTGSDIYLCMKDQSTKIKEIYKQIDIDISIHDSSIFFKNKYKSNIFNNFKNIQSTFNPKIPILDCIKILEMDVDTYIKNLDSIDHIKNKYNNLLESGLEIQESVNVGLTVPVPGIDESISYASVLPKKKSNKHIYVKDIPVKGIDESIGYASLLQKDNFNRDIDTDTDESLGCFQKVYSLKNLKNKQLFKEINLKVIKNNVLYIHGENTVVVMNDSFDYETLYFKDITYIGESSNGVANMYHKQVYSDIESFKTLFNNLQKIKMINHIPIDDTFKLLKGYILNNYTITDKQEDRIKSSVLYNQFMNDLKVNIKNARDCTISLCTFSNDLMELGLKKKRYSDGFYYYGLSELNIKIDETKNVNELYDNLLKSRKDESENDIY